MACISQVQSGTTFEKRTVVSPTMKVRVREKEELADLNDRLAAYIDRVRSLESQNAQLSAEIHHAKDNRVREIDNIKLMYEEELAESRRLLDDISKEKALLKLENNKLNEILSDLRPKFEQEQISNKQLQGKLISVEQNLNEKEKFLAIKEKDKIELENHVKELETNLEDLEIKLARDKDNLEKEIIARVDAENKCQTLKEESLFNSQVFQKEVSSKQDISSAPLECNISVDYEDMLLTKLQELREEFEEEAKNGKKELEQTYCSKLDKLKGQNDKDRITISKLLTKQDEVNGLVETLRSDNNLLLSRIDQSQKRIIEIDGLRVSDRENLKLQLEESESKTTTLQQKYEALEIEYETLLGIKVTLDMELAAYNKLLEGEEQRLNLQPAERKRQSRKRKYKEATIQSKPCIESSASGVIFISDVDESGKSIIISNNGDDDEDIGGFLVQRNIDEVEKGHEFKFPDQFMLPPGQSVTIWSESRGEDTLAPNDFVMDGDWPTGKDRTVTTIVDKSNTIIAKFVNMTTVYLETGATTTKKDSTGGNCMVM